MPWTYDFSMETSYEGGKWSCKGYLPTFLAPQHYRSQIVGFQRLHALPYSTRGAIFHIPYVLSPALSELSSLCEDGSMYGWRCQLGTSLGKSTYLLSIP